jgi:hypothetical protein
MRCYICDKQAEELAHGDPKLVDCVGCGPYAISGTVIGLRNQDIRVFRIDDTRAWLQAQRDSGEQRPLINSSNVIWD